MNHHFYLVHPSLIEKKLIPDENSHYALVTYPYSIISSAISSIMNALAPSDITIELNSKKRIKFLMEFYAVTLSLSIDQTYIMEYVENQYEKWLLNPDFLGSLERQNKYFRRILQHLSLPFTFKNAHQHPTIFNDQYYLFLIKILHFLNGFHTNKGKIFEKETWIILFKTVLISTNSIITFDYHNLISKQKYDELCKRSVSVLFSICFTSGIFTLDIWNLLKEYGFSWSENINFLKIWGKNLCNIFLQLLLLIYPDQKSDHIYNYFTNVLKQTSFSTIIKINPDLFNKGVYLPPAEPMNIKQCSFILYQLIKSYDYHKINNSEQ